MLNTQQSDFGRGPAIWQAGGHGEEPLHFAAANGFPVASYTPFLAHFQSDYHIIGLENRGVWDHQPPPRGFSWRQHADDLIAFLEHAQTRPVIAMGHSIGATVSALADRQAFIDYHRNKAAYRRFSADAFNEYAQAGLIEQADGQYKLSYNREWEAHNFKHTFSPWQALRNIQVPTLVLRAEHSYLHKAKEFERRVKRLSPFVSHGVIKGAGHMALQEDCEQVVKLSRDWLQCTKLLRSET